MTCPPPWIEPRTAYIHVPFCAHHCGYCDFAVAAGFLASSVCLRQFTAIALATGLGLFFSAGLMSMAAVINALRSTKMSNAWVDGLSAFFLVPVFLVSLLGNIYGLSYWKQTEHPDNGRKLRLFYGLLTAGMALWWTPPAASWSQAPPDRRTFRSRGHCRAPAS